MKRKWWFSALLTVVIVLGAAGLALMPAQARGPIDQDEPEAPVPHSLTLAPATAEGFVGDVHEKVATVWDRDRNPLEGVEVSFVVTGAHRVTGRAVTDWRGQAPFSYLGMREGEDKIVAFAGDLTARATMRWKWGWPQILVATHEASKQISQKMGGAHASRWMTQGIRGMHADDLAHALRFADNVEAKLGRIRGKAALLDIAGAVLDGTLLPCLKVMGGKWKEVAEIAEKVMDAKEKAEKVAKGIKDALGPDEEIFGVNGDGIDGIIIHDKKAKNVRAWFTDGKFVIHIRFDLDPATTTYKNKVVEDPVNVK